MPDKERFEKNFKEVLQKKAEVLKGKYSQKYLDKIKLKGVLKAGNFIADLQTNEEIEKYKKDILNYLNEFIYTSNQYSNRKIVLFRQKYLSSVIDFLNGEYEFYPKGYLIFAEILIGMGVDFILFAVGLAKFYNYIPIFTTIYLIQIIRRYKRIKKEDKILDL